MKQLIIGDIHGCYTDQLELLDRAGLSDQDEIIAIGDIVDRGPDSPRILAFFREHPRARSIQGNHERKHVRSWRGEVMPALSQRITRQQVGEEAYPDAVAFMDALPRFLKLTEAILVHGFWEPGLSIAEQREVVIVGTMTGEMYLRERHVRSWYELYDGEKPIVVGHLDYLGTGQPFVYRDRVFGLDTGCCCGGSLTGLILPEWKFVSVRSQTNYWQQVKAEFEPVKRERVPEPPAVWDAANVAVLNLICAHFLREHEQVLAQLCAQVAFDTLSEHEQARMYAEQIGSMPLARFLHLARRGELTPERLRRIFKRPEHARDFAIHHDLLSADEPSKAESEQ
jgi:serine/threonine protein phosphatase 1